VNNDVYIVSQYPGGGVVSAEAISFFTDLCGVLVYLVDDRPHLAVGGSGGDDKKVGDGGKAAEVKDNHIFATVVVGNSGGLFGELQGVPLRLRVIQVGHKFSQVPKQLDKKTAQHHYQMLHRGM
jgi:hypothetical protein